MRKKPILCVDFDGVIHSYTSPWVDEATIPDPPVPGALRWLWKATEWFNVVIYSSRSKSEAGRTAMMAWMCVESVKEFGADHPMCGHQDPDYVYPIGFAAEKPAALLSHEHDARDSSDRSARTAAKEGPIMRYPLASASQQSEKYVVNASLLRKSDERDWYLAPRDDLQVDASEAARMFAPFSARMLLTCSDAFGVVTVTPDNVRFQNLVIQWRKERGVTSSPIEMAMCPAYQRIMSMGPAVVPLILQQIESEGDDPDHWFWALRYLTDDDPVSFEDRGDMKKMAAAWIDWGRRRLYGW